LRQQLSGLTGHLRAVSRAVGRKEEPQGLSEFSRETQPRKLLKRKEQHELPINKLSLCEETGNWEYNLKLLTKRERVVLLPLTCKAWPGSSQNTYTVECTTTITKIGTTCNTCNSLSSDPPITVTFCRQVRYGAEFEIPLRTVDGWDVTLQPDTLYTVSIEMNGRHLGHYSEDSDSGSYSNDHLTLVISHYSSQLYNFSGWYFFPSDKLRYRI
jgi:hypothetical protein